MYLHFFPFSAIRRSDRCGFFWRDKDRVKRIFAGIASAGAILVFSTSTAFAASISAGDPAVSRSAVDTYSNFTIIDTNAPVSATGFLTALQYYATNTNPFEFVVVNGGNIVQWISPTVTPASVGVQSYAITIPVQAGWNVGMHFDSTGTIPFDATGTPASYTQNNSGMPTVGSALSVAGTSDRVYSLNAIGTAAICSATDLVSGTSTQQAGYTETTEADPSTALVASSYSGAGTWSPAFATQAVIPPWIDPSANSVFAGSGAVWISTNATWPGGAGNTEGSPGNDQWRLFKDSFTIPQSAVVTSSELSYAGDNAVDVYLNGNATSFASTTGTYGDAPAGNPSYFGSVFTAAFTPIIGANTLDFVVRNWGGAFTSNPTGLLYKAVVNYCTPTSGVLAVIKTAVGADGTFSFTGTNGVTPFTITTVGGVGSHNETLPIGSYSVTETIPSGWTEVSSGCTDVPVVADTITACTITDSYDSAALHVVTLVVNNNGGTATSSDFIVHVKSATSTLDVFGSPVSGTSTPGVSYTLFAGAYVVSEDATSSYTQSFGGDCDASGAITLSVGDNKTCTITNTDIPPSTPSTPTTPSSPVVTSGGGGGSGPIVGLLGGGGGGSATLSASANGAACVYSSSDKNPDINRDGVVNILDFNALLVAWGMSGAQNADITHDCVVDVFDFNALMAGWTL